MKIVKGYTHAGVFHLDDVMAAAILRILNAMIQFVRVFKAPETVQDNEIVFDIGEGRYDHHGSACESRENGVRYAACGLIWRSFGKQVLQIFNCPEDLLDAVWKRVDFGFIQAIDARDNGQTKENPRGIYPTYELADAVFSMNPFPGEEVSSDEQFEVAVQFAGLILKREIVQAIATEKGRVAVEDAIDHSEGTYMVLHQFVKGWQGLLKHSANPKAETITTAVYPSLRGGWNVQVVPGFLFPERWAGQSASNLASMTGVDGFTFCHQGRFICGTKTEADAIRVAELAAVAA